MDKFRGSLLAGAVGDALGGAIEFEHMDAIRARFGPAGLTDFAPAYGKVGAITDDTQMTLFTLEGLVIARKHGTDPLWDVRAAYGRWLHTQGGPAVRVEGWLLDEPGMFSQRAPGTTCLSALYDEESFGTTSDHINNSKGCGGVMRAAPVALWSEDVDEVFALAAGTAAITHGHPSGFLSAGVLAVIVQQVLVGASVMEAVAEAREELVRWDEHEELLEVVDLAVRLGSRGKRPTPELIETLFGGGWVGEEALGIGLYAALVAESVEDGLLLAVNISGDSDSTGSVCGNILGARDGVEGIPRRWLEGVELGEVLERSADEAGGTFGVYG
ncbi:ADP-ribosylglycohydrolase family protein [Umezawaea endophytica]|uniref:ADP-ribosylglycohydrolase family protein n=1 Tax=Umezawaea endophytica TaxID=1654476 RepID=A0A9X3ALF4_9PSEU|nr:ADP-ribosylglycohydrolase family protein [Umezawaea endophytica]MCS7484350.1 ADP-ribosylglycohydrolase family protein [Umezawaea endophytica]